MSHYINSIKRIPSVLSDVTSLPVCFSKIQKARKELSKMMDHTLPDKKPKNSRVKKINTLKHLLNKRNTLNGFVHTKSYFPLFLLQI